MTMKVMKNRVEGDRLGTKTHNFRALQAISCKTSTSRNAATGQRRSLHSRTMKSLVGIVNSSIEDDTKLPLLLDRRTDRVETPSHTLFKDAEEFESKVTRIGRLTLLGSEVEDISEYVKVATLPSNRD